MNAGRREFLERLGNPHAQFGCHRFFDLLKRKGPDVVLQPGQSVQVRLGQEISAAGKDLAELHKGGPHLFEVARQFVRFGLPMFHGVLLEEAA